jgi:hypothetical protein
MSEDKILEEMEKYYSGYSFDGNTLVYNPFSIIEFFRYKKLTNYWFGAGDPDILLTFLRRVDTLLQVKQFSNIPFSLDRAMNPRNNIFMDPESFLYQMGVLSLRPSKEINEFILDYPNTEVKESLAIRILENYYESGKEAQAELKKMQEAIANRDPAKLIEVLNRYLSSIPLRDHIIDGSHESHFRKLLISLFFLAGLTFHAESDTSIGKSDLDVQFNGVTWVFELKVVYQKDTDKDEIIAEKALSQIINKNYGGSYENPVLLGLAINDTKRIITSWSCKGGMSEKPEPMPEKEN